MTQIDFDIIIRLINEGAPAIANGLTKSFTEFVQEKIKLDTKVSELEEKLKLTEKKSETKKN